VEQDDNKHISNAMMTEVIAIPKRNQKEPEKRRAEVAAIVASIKQVLCRFCRCFA
jgi:hypothetical protein